MRVAILGAGKSGTLCMAQARLALGQTGRLVAVDRSVEVLSEALAEGIIDAGDAVDAKDALGAARRITELLGGEADVVINTANVDATEMAAILSVREGGTVYFFNMATSFARAALGAEGVGKDANLMVGNGYAVGHAELALDLVRSSPFVRRKFERALGSNP
jgi:L-erythro-3,5-diaminohexanoate dehydrogenase